MQKHQQNWYHKIQQNSNETSRALWKNKIEVELRR